MENWQTVLFDSMRGEGFAAKGLPAFFYIVWIFIGNFILLNLFLAILIDSFLKEDDDDNLSDEQLEEKRLAKEKRKEDKEKERLRKLKKMGANMKQANLIFLR